MSKDANCLEGTYTSQPGASESAQPGSVGLGRLVRVEPDPPD